MHTRTITLIVLMFSFLTSLVADEGSWLPYHLRKNHAQHLRMNGFSVTPEYFYSETQPSAKDAVVLIGKNLGTGTIVSQKGLVITNYNIIFPFLEEAGTEENNIKEGFWSQKQEEEIPLKGLSIFLLQEIRDVTVEILKNAPSITERRKNHIKKQIELLKQKHSKNGTLEVVVDPIYNGHQYMISVYKEYKDIRIAGAPSAQIAQFGGEDAMWKWPRHNADFCFLRIYCDSLGNGTSYHKDNQALSSPFFLPFSQNEAQDGDITITMGYPKSSNRYISSYDIHFIANIASPPIIEVCDVILPSMQQSIDKNAAYKEAYGGIYDDLDDIWKKQQGIQYIVSQQKTIEKRKKNEDFIIEQLEASNEKSKLEALFSKMDKTKKNLDLDAYRAYWYTNISILTSKILKMPLDFHAIKPSRGSDRKNSVALADTFLHQYQECIKGMDADLEKKIIKASIQLCKKLPEKYQPNIQTFVESYYKNDYNIFVDAIMNESIFSNEKAFKKFLRDPSLYKYEKDPLVRYYYAIIETLVKGEKLVKPANQKITEQQDEYIELLFPLLLQSGVATYPDANGTMRYNIGTMTSYEAEDGITFHSRTTFKGIAAKYNPNNKDRNLPKEYLSVISQEENIDHTACFITNNDLFDGNAGNPIINSDGEIIGISSTINWEALSNEIMYCEDLQRSINVDAQHILLILRDYAKAQSILEELLIK